VNTKVREAGAIAVAGLALALCVPPFPFGALVPLVLTAILGWLASKTPGQSALAGFLSGLVFHAATLHWIKNVMNVGPPVTIALGLGLLIAYLSAFHALWAFAWSHCLRRDRLWAWPFLFTGIELVRGWGQMSFPWLHIAYGFGSNLPLLQGASVLGVYGIGLCIASTAVLLHAARTGRLDRKWLIAPVAFWGLWITWGALRLAPPVGSPAMKVALVQPAIPQTRKWEESYFQGVVEKTFATAGRIRDRVDLWVFPETALPDFWTWRPEVTARFQRLSDTARAPVVVGALEAVPDAKAPMGARVLNSAFLLEPGRAAARYDKIRLVPFSERLPFDDVLPALNQVKLGQSGFSAGDTVPVWTTGLPWSPAICFEQVHPDFVRHAAQHGAKAMVVITNDGWFGNSLGPRQHWNIHRFHAVENGLSMVRAANTGVSGATDPRGIVLARTAMMADTALVVSIPAGAPSLYARFGGWLDGILWIFAVAALLAVCLPGSRRHRGAPGS
jgi:apolipoprotein N-acyltransferase